MAEEKKPGKAAEFFVKHGEKVALVAAALGLVAYLVLGIAMAKEDDSARKLKIDGEKARGEMKKSHADMKAPEAKSLSSEALAPWTKVANVNPTKNDWVATLPTEIRITEFVKPEPPKRVARHPDFSLGGAEVALDGITITWSTTGFTVTEMTKDKATTDFVKLSHFLVEREVAGSGKWEVLAERVPLPPPPKTEKGIAPATLNFRDAKIEPKTKYNYRVTGFLALDDLKKLDPAKVNLSGIDSKEGKVGTLATDNPVTTLGIWKIRFANVMKGQAYIEIEKFDRDHGKQKISHIHYAGDKIGWWKQNPQAENEEPVSVHPVTAGTKRLDVDFNTGMTLKSVEPKKVTVEVTKCTRKYDPATSGEIPHEPVVEKVQVEVIEVLYTDEDGKDQAFYHPRPENHPLAVSRACSEHGGRKVEVVPKDAPKKDDLPKEDPKVAAAKKAEADAEKLFLEAEKAEAAKDKASALAKYQKLLKDFAATDFVSKNKKAVIEDRIKKLTP
jgi:hypothetical protein